MYSSRRPNSSVQSTPDRLYHSPSSAYSVASSTTSLRSRNPVTVVARSVAGAFVSCVTLPEIDSSITQGYKVSDKFRDQSVASNASGSHDGRYRSGSERERSSSGSRSHNGRYRSGSERERSSNCGAYASPYKSTNGKEQGSMEFTTEEIFAATRNFSPSCKIGQGGFGAVYKGRLEDGTPVAVKRAKKCVQDNKLLGVEFQSEIRTLAQVEHLNLVRFYGYLEHGDERIVVVEYVPNGTLREHLDCMRGKVIDLAVRLNIATDVAHAVTYLHLYTDHPIIHRDIKSSNILLTGNFRAKVADFGFARLAADTDSGATHVSTQVKGTAGYLDPEYLKTNQLTEKSDVYSFGVLLVEMVTGRRPIEAKRELEERITARWAMKKFTEGDAIAVLDPRLEGKAANKFVLEKILELALQCLAPQRRSRPSMRRCAEILWRIRKAYRELLTSDFYSQSSRSRMRGELR